MISKEKSKLSQLIFKVAYAIILIDHYVTKVPFLSKTIKIFKIIAIILLLFNCIIQSKTYYKKTIATILSLIIINMISYYITDDSVFLVLFLIIFSAKNIDINKFIKYDIIVKICIVLGLFILSKLGLTTEFTFFRDGIQRYSFGFAHPNGFGIAIASIFVELTYLHRNKLNISYIIIVSIIMLIVSYYSDSRASAMLLLLTIICCIWKNGIISKFIYSKIGRVIIQNAWYVFSLVTAIMTILYFKETNIGIELNIIFSNRLKWIVTFLTNYNIKLFGNEITYVSTEASHLLGIKSAVLDNAFSRVLINYGIIIYFILGFYIKKLICYAYKEKNTVLIWVLFILIMYGIAEKNCYTIYTNVFLVYISKIIFEKDNKNRIESK